MRAVGAPFGVGGVHEVRSFTTRPAVAGLEGTEKLERKEKDEGVELMVLFRVFC